MLQSNDQNSTCMLFDSTMNELYGNSLLVDYSYWDLSPTPLRSFTFTLSYYLAETLWLQWKEDMKCLNLTSFTLSREYGIINSTMFQFLRNLFMYVYIYMKQLYIMLH